MIFLLIIVILLLVEIALIYIVRGFRTRFQWLITENDEFPELPEQPLNKFINSSFDSKLGWVRKPNTSGVEKGKNGEITFLIDSEGSRRSSFPDFEKTIAVFGDSYAFCRQVMDEETWEEGVARSLRTGVLNYGVGNYGADQALIRYKGETLPETVDIAILCFVPETICRVQSYWKHYLEFGNTFAFKPRFILSDTGKLLLVESAMQSPTDFDLLKDKLPEIQKNDGFYQRKFRKLQFRKPYIVSLFRAPARHFNLLSILIADKLGSFFKANSGRTDNRAFASVMRNNIREAREMYSDDNAQLLLKKILLEFKDVAQHRGHIPLILVIPQLLDFYEDKSRDMPYSKFYDAISGDCAMIDMAATFRDYDLSEIYINDQYGGHLSAKGNELVAESVGEWVKSLSLSKIQK